MLQVWNSLMNVPLKLWKRRKTIYIFFLKGGFNKLERSTILSLILKLSLSTKLWINEYVSCGFPRAYHFMPNSLLVDLIQYFNRMLSRKFIKIKVSYVSYIVIDILINHHSPQTFPYIDLSPRDLHSVA